MTLLRYAVSIVVGLFFSLPVVWLLAVSFMKRVDLFRSPPQFLFSPTSSNYRKIYIDGEGFSSLITTILTGFTVAAFATIVALLYYLPKLLSGEKKPSIETFLLPAYALPGVIIAIPFFFYVSALGINSYFSWFGGLLASAIIISMLLISGFINDLPTSCIDTLRVHRPHRLISNSVILARDLRSAILITLLFSFLVCWHDLAISIVTNSGDLKSVNMSINGLITPIGTYWGQIAALSTPSILLAILFSVSANEKILRGFSFGR